MSVGTELQQGRGWDGEVDAAVARLSRAIAASDSLEEIVQLALEQARRMTGSLYGYAGYLDLWGGRRDVFSWEGYDGCGSRHGDQFLLPGELAKIGDWILSSKRSLLINSREDLPDEAALQGRQAIGRLLAAPVVSGEMLLGYLATVDAGRDYDKQDLTLLEQLASVCALAIELQQRDEEVRRLCEELEQRVIERAIQERQAQERIGNIQQQLFHAQKMEAAGQLAGGMAHELNNQLTIVHACVDLCLARLHSEDPIRREILKIQKSARDSAKLTRQLLLFGGNNLHHKLPTALNQSVEELQETMQHMLGAEISVKLDTCPDLWLVDADASSIEQVIVNLVINARDAMPDGGAITIKTENTYMSHTGRPGLAPGRYACLSVTDEGAGIDTANLSHIFEPFFTTKAPGKGTGLGLSVAYGIIQSHDGWIEVDSIPGQGSTFRIYLPALMAEAEAPADPSRPAM